jgi:hypothetical protein
MIYFVIAAASFLVISIGLLARRRPDYSHVGQTISELGEHGSATEKPAAFGVFLPFGVMMAAIAYQSRINEPALLLAGAMAVGYIGAAFFPVDAGAPIFGTWRNGLHWLAGIIEYVGAIAAFSIADTASEFPIETLKYAVIAGLAAMNIPGLRNYRGLLQRVVEVAMLTGLGLFVI